MELAPFRAHGSTRPGVLPAGQAQMELAPFRAHGSTRPGVLPAGQVQMELAPFTHPIYAALLQSRQRPKLQQDRIEMPEYPDHQQNNYGHPPASQRRPRHSDHMEHQRPRMPGSCRLHVPRIPAASSARLTNASPAHSHNLPVPPDPGEERIEVVHAQAPSSTSRKRKSAPHRAWQQSMQRVADERRQPEPQQRRRNDKARRAGTCGTGDDGQAEDSGERQQ